MDIVNEIDVPRLLKKDRLFRNIHSQYGEPPNWKRKPGFVSLCRIILEQQISLNAAKAHYVKLKDYVGSFTTSNILKLSDIEFRNCQISRQKMTYLRELASEIENRTINLANYKTMDDESIRSEMIRIKGIGNWTIDVYLLFCLQSKDVFPIGDIAIRKAIYELNEVKEENDVLELSRKWKPYRSLATYYLWHYYLSSRRKLFPFSRET